MLSTPQKLLLIGLSALAPAIAQATFIKHDVWAGGKTGSSLFVRHAYKTEFSRSIDFDELHNSLHALLNSWHKVSSNNSNKGWQAIGPGKEISQLLRSKKRFAFERGGKGRHDFLAGNKSKRIGNKNKRERSISVPEPGTVALLAMGLAGLGLSRRGEQQRGKQV